MRPASFHHSGIPRSCIAPLVRVTPEAAAYPGASGTGFFAKARGELFFFTALHCLESPTGSLSADEAAQQLLIPYRTDGSLRHPDDYVRFDNLTRLAEGPARTSFFDVAALHVTPGRTANHRHLLSRAAKLPPSGLWLDEFASLDQAAQWMHQRGSLPATVIGYPNEGTGTAISYPDDHCNTLTIEAQPAEFLGHLRPSPLDHCMLLDGSTWPRSHSGFSGSPVFFQWDSPHGRLSTLAGMIICGNSSSLHFVGISTLVRAAVKP